MPRLDTATLRRTAIRAAGPVAVRVRVPSGPRLVRGLLVRARLDQARRALRSGGPPSRTEQFVQPLLSDGSPNARTAWLIVAEARSAAGDPTGALEAARAATDGPQTTVNALLLRRRLAAQLGHEEEAYEALRRTATCTPRTEREATAAVRELGRAGRDLVETFVDTMRSAGFPTDAAWIEQLRAEAALGRAFESGRAELVAEVDRVRREVPDGSRVALRALLHAGEWRLAGDVVAEIGDAALPLASLSRSAPRALRAGWAGAAVTMARRVLASKPDDDRARAVLLEGTDLLQVADEGIRVPAPASRVPYAPGTRHVLNVLAQSLPLTSGGYATRSHGIAASMRDRGWEVRGVTRLGFPYDRWPASDERTVPSVDVVDGVPYHRLLEAGAHRSYAQHPLQSYIDRFAAMLVEQATEHRASLLHGASFHVNGLATAAAARRLGLPHVYEMRGLEDLMKVSRHPDFAESDRYRFTTRLELDCCLLAERVFVITDALRREMVDRGVPAEKLTVLPNGVHTATFTPRDRDRELEAALGLRDKRVIGYVGGLVDYEGLDLLLDAVAALHQERSDFHLLVVGDGHYERALHTHAERLRLGEVVTFTGRVPHSEASRYLSLIDITPFPRKPLPVCELISPIKPFEAMAMGKAAVVSSVAALTEIVRDDDTGLVFTKGDVADLAHVLGRLLDDEPLRLRLGESARAWVLAERDWSSIVSVVDDVYREVLDARPAGGS